MKPVTSENSLRRKVEYESQAIGRAFWASDLNKWEKWAAVWPSSGVTYNTIFLDA